MHFYLPPHDWRAPFRLRGREALHLSRVLRLGPGAEVRLLDGEGREGLFRVESADRDRVLLTFLAEKTRVAPAGGAVLAVAWTKALRRGFFLEKAAEFGAAELWFWQARRSQGRMPDDVQEAWRARVAAGAKQCGNPLFPLLRVIPGGAEGLARRAPSGRRTVLLEPGADCPLLDVSGMGGEEKALYVLGPEGGFEAAESALLIGAGFAPASLGERPLRWESAALLCLGLHYWFALGVECQHVVHPPSLEAGGLLPRAECGRR
jgi:16S rRNA (uracil1498-N3)-methyltransferase